MSLILVILSIVLIALGFVFSGFLYALYKSSIDPWAMANFTKAPKEASVGNYVIYRSPGLALCHLGLLFSAPTVLILIVLFGSMLGQMLLAFSWTAGETNIVLSAWNGFLTDHFIAIGVAGLIATPFWMARYFFRLYLLGAYTRLYPGQVDVLDDLHAMSLGYQSRRDFAAYVAFCFNATSDQIQYTSYDVERWTLDYAKAAKICRRARGSLGKLARKIRKIRQKGSVYRSPISECFVIERNKFGYVDNVATPTGAQSKNLSNSTRNWDRARLAIDYMIAVRQKT